MTHPRVEGNGHDNGETEPVTGPKVDSAVDDVLAGYSQEGEAVSSITVQLGVANRPDQWPDDGSVVLVPQNKSERMEYRVMRQQGPNPRSISTPCAFATFENIDEVVRTAQQKGRQVVVTPKYRALSHSEEPRGTRRGFAVYAIGQSAEANPGTANVAPVNNLVAWQAGELATAMRGGGSSAAPARADAAGNV
ncbi:MAG: hypothetical protein AAB588_05235 [Patescibacteria group bacterium]